MKKFLLIALLFSACKKDSTQDKLQYGCEYGVNKTTGVREFIFCVPHDIYMAGNNQAAANSVADNLGIAHVDVSIVANYTSIEFVPNANCDCN